MNNRLTSRALSFLNLLILGCYSTWAFSGCAAEGVAPPPPTGPVAVASSWLPMGSAQPNDTVSGGVDKWLQTLSARLRPLACEYQGASLAAAKPFRNGQVADKSWDLKVRSVKVTGQPDALDLVADFTMLTGQSAEAGVALAFDFNNWSAENYVLIPASVYNGNRKRVVNRKYAAGLDRSDMYRKDLPLTILLQPQLSPVMGASSKIELLTSNASSPAICLFDRNSERGFILLAEQGLRVNGKIRDHGLIVEESSDRQTASLLVTAPGVRSKRPQFISGFSPSPDRGLALKAGDKIQMRLQLHSFAARDIPTVLEKFMSVRKAVTGPNSPRHLLPSSEIIRLLSNLKHARFSDGVGFKYYRTEQLGQYISFGWVGGLMDTFPMLALNTDRELERVTQNFDFAMPRGQGPSGYFYGALGHDGRPLDRGGYKEFPEVVLTRKNADVLFYMVKQFNLLEAQGRGAAVKPAWKENVQNLADAFVATWKKDGQWGNYLNNKTGQVAVYNSTSAAMAPGGLALASQYYRNPEYLKIAEEAAHFYYQRDFVALGMTTAHSGDTLQNADGDSAVAFMTSLMALYEVTGKSEWLDKSRNLANLVATWTDSYDYEFPKTTDLGALGAKLAGTFWASTQNKHAAPGFCTYSGDPLFKIYRATGDERYAELMRDVRHAHAEGIKPGGYIAERLGHSDASDPGSRGTPKDSTSWCETNGLLMAMELPGIYVRHDLGRIYVFDSVEARFLGHDAAGTKLEITNRTKHDAQISVFAEGAAAVAKPLGDTAFIHWPKVEVKAGQTRVVTVPAKSFDGKS